MEAFGLAWELRGPGVKVMTEDDFVTDQGDVTTTGEQNPIAARWAEAMNQNYEKLSAKQPVFGQLRNLMDLCVIAALIDQEQLLDRAGCELPIMTGENGDFLPESWNPPKTVSSQCSVMKRGSEYIITASGGVQINAYRNAFLGTPRTSTMRRGSGGIGKNDDSANARTKSAQPP